MEYTIDRTWAEVNLDNIEHNTRAVAGLVGKNTEIMAVVKADAYGHGVLEVAKTVLNSGARRLGVSTLDEAIQLRQKGIDCPILVFSDSSPLRAKEIVEFDITQTVFNMDIASAISEVAKSNGKKIKIHVKVDTGMTRIGFMPGYSTVKNITEIGKLPGIIIEGIYTHFASADEEDDGYTEFQFERFMNIINELGRVGIHIPVKHCCNSAAILRFPHMHLDMVRPGLILYGLYPSDDEKCRVADLKPAMEWKAHISHLKQVEKDVFISYGRIFRTNRESIIATVPIGYADGYTRLLSEKGLVLINGEYAPVVGRICMDQCMVDVTDIEGSKIGDEVVLFGSQEGRNISVEDVAKRIGTISYEVICIVGKRVPRIYIKNGTVNKVLNYLIDS